MPVVGVPRASRGLTGFQPLKSWKLFETELLAGK